MPTPMKLDILFCMFAYGGNGGISMVLPSHVKWWGRTIQSMNSDDRIGRVAITVFSDTPLTMTRNRAVETARKGNYDVMIFLDSDNEPDIKLGHDPHAKSFWESSFDFLYERKLRGLPSLVAAPYCGPPPHPIGGGEENVYVFHWEALEGDVDNPPFKLAAYSRDHAAKMIGIQPIGAGPTGCCIYTTDTFDLIEPPYFFYEFKDPPRCTEKCSTEDVTNFRELTLAGDRKFSDPIIYCNWDAWAGHHKPKCVGPPAQIFVDTINKQYVAAVKADFHSDERMANVDFTGPKDAVVEETPAESPNGEISPEGVPLMGRIIDGRKVTSVGHLTNDTDLQALTQLVATVVQTRRDRPLRVIEVGSWVGESALALRAGFGDKRGTVYCVDTFEGNTSDPARTGNLPEVVQKLGPGGVKKWFQKNVGDLLGNEIRLVEQPSIEAAAELGYSDADVIFIDAEHTYESTLDDILTWLPHLNTDGVICGHDYSPQFPGVVKAVDEVCAEAGISPHVPQGTRIWFFAAAEYQKGLDANRAAASQQADGESTEPLQGAASERERVA